MASIKRKSSGGGGANWMDTYGDMVTLLLCFFVLLYSMSTISPEKWMLIVQSFNKDAEVSTDDRPLGPDGESDQERGEDMPMTQDQINEQVDMILEYLAEYAAASSGSPSDAPSEAENVTVAAGDGYIHMKIPSGIMFGGDSDVLLPAGAEILDGIIPTLEDGKLYINQVLVVGHTATAQRKYDAKFDRKLAAGRAAAVVAYLQENTTIQPARLVDQGYGQWMPIAPNEAEEDRAMNRRVDIFISYMDEVIENPFAGSITEYYTKTEQENPDPIAAMYTTNTEAEE